MKKLNRLYRFYKEYGCRCFIAKILSDIFPYTNQESHIRHRILQHKFDVYFRYLNKYYLNSCLESEIHNEGGTQYPEYIWTAWLQGEDKAPEVIRMNFASIRKNAAGHPVVVITEENVENYLSIPPQIKTKHKQGIISHAHYADVIRMMLLEKHGGLWLDSTVFLHHPVDEKAFKMPFYSVGFQADKGKFVSEHKWLVRVIGGKVQSPYLSVISRMLSTYWTEHDVPIDYFVFDYLIAILYRSDQSFHMIIDQLPKMPFFTNALMEVINEPYNQTILKERLLDNQIYCFSYRNQYRKTTKEGQLTNYGYFYRKLTEEQTERE